MSDFGVQQLQFDDGYRGHLIFGECLWTSSIPQNHPLDILPLSRYAGPLFWRPSVSYPSLVLLVDLFCFVLRLEKV